MSKNSDNSWDNFYEQIKKAKEQLKNGSDNRREDVSEILRKRAEQIATKDEESRKKYDFLSVLEFTLGQEKYAIETKYLKEIMPANQITDLPCTPKHIFGVINIRGKIITVLDLKKILNLDYVGINDFASIVVVDYNNSLIGIIADTITGIRDINLETIIRDKPDLIKIKDDFFLGITNETLLLLNINNIISDKSLLVNETVN